MDASFDGGCGNESATNNSQCFISCPIHGFVIKAQIMLNSLFLNWMTNFSFPVFMFVLIWLFVSSEILERPWDRLFTFSVACPLLKVVYAAFHQQVVIFPSVLPPCWRGVNNSHFIFSSSDPLRLRNVLYLRRQLLSLNLWFMYFRSVTACTCSRTDSQSNIKETCVCCVT